MPGRNRLASETSPYLRQHADNPVDWWPWGAEAFAEAARRDVPVLLSVGYSACHWCHVMAHESFEDDATARVLNELFVSVKVDREERPDVDAVYMDAVTAANGSGGWPMTVWCTPDGRPFLAGTYFPKTGGQGRPSFLDVCQAVTQAWREKRPELEKQADELRDSVVERSRASYPAVGLPDGGREASVMIEKAMAGLAESSDEEWGGFGRPPKFPQPAVLELALRGAAADPQGPLALAARKTLDAMASGGIYDQLGGGFARYATDRRWLVPHFEKMLYDQAGLLRAYLHGWQIYGAPAWRQVCEETVAYVERDLAQPEGGISSAEDADSEGQEGRFYVWDHDELQELGGPEAVAWYGASTEGNWDGTNILWRPVRGDLVRPDDVEAARARLFSRRSERVRPGLDDKVVTEWNAMWAAALAEAGSVLGRPDWVAAAERILIFLHDSLRRPDGRWLRSWHRDGGARHLAVANDVAWVIEACTRMAEATGSFSWVARAGEAADQLIDRYEDQDIGGVFTVADDGEMLIARQKDTYDGATASANTVAATALGRLGALTGNERWTAAGRRVLDFLGPMLAVAPLAAAGAVAALASVLNGPTEVVITGQRPDLVAAAFRPYRPDRVVAWGDRYPGPLWDGRDQDGVAYVCRGYACQRPVATSDELTALI